VKLRLGVSAVTFGGATLFLIFGVIYLYKSFAISDISMPIDAGDAAAALL
jgi:hypothetical protein